MADKAKKDEVIFKSLSEPMLDGQIPIKNNWPDFNVILVFIIGGLVVTASFVILWMFFKIRSLAAPVVILQQINQAKAFPTVLSSFIYKQVTEAASTSSLSVDMTLKWDHALFFLNIMILAVLFIVLLKIYKHSHLHIPWLYAEITTINDCILLPIMRLPLCPTQCLVQGPYSITNLNVHGSCLSSTLKVRWPDFYVLNGVTGQKLKVTEKIKVSVFQLSKLKS